MGGICLGAMALVVILSAFNGLESLVASLYDSFDPDIKITATKGKTFSIEEFPEQDILKLTGVEFGAKSLEETVVIKYNGKQTFATLKGVEQSFIDMNSLDSMMYEGKLVLKDGDLNYMVLGYGIADKIGLYMDKALEPIFVYAARRTKIISSNVASAFKVQPILPAGIFSINPDFDNEYILAPFNFAEQVLSYSDRVSAYEIGLAKNSSPEEVKEEVKKLLGENYTVKTRYEQNELIYKTNQTEKWITFLILSFVLVVATFNLVGSLSMLIIDKKKDIFILKSMGATKNMVFKIFLIEGIMISVIGGLLGLFFGATLTWMQQTFGLVPLAGLIVDYYPMEMELFDFVAVFLTVLVIGFGASWFPAKLISTRYYSNLTREN